jgi:hypothetical protein
LIHLELSTSPALPISLYCILAANAGDIKTSAFALSILYIGFLWTFYMRALAGMLLSILYIGFSA